MTQTEFTGTYSLQTRALNVWYGPYQALVIV